MVKKWSELKFWKSGECQVVYERLRDIRRSGGIHCPARASLWKAMDLLPFNEVKVVLMGQDPYPDPKYATGMAFSIPSNESEFPPTLKTIMKEYQDDLHHDSPRDGDLRAWVHRGVFLWNALPSCGAHHSLSHDWPEYHLLTAEITTELSKHNPGVVFVFLGAVARRFSEYVDPGVDVLSLSHPSPRASRASRNPFLGSRMFTTVNLMRQSKGFDPINWELSNVDGQRISSSQEEARSLGSSSGSGSEDSSRQTLQTQ